MNVEVVEPWNPLPWFSLAGVLLILVSLVALPRPSLRPGKKCIGYWPLLGLALLGFYGAISIWPNSFITAIGYEVFALSIYVLIKHFGNERADNAAWVWLLSSQIAFILMLFFALNPSAFPHYWWLLFVFLCPIWPLSFWWQGSVSQSPLPVSLLLFYGALIIPLGYYISSGHIPWAYGYGFPDALLIPALLGLYFAALSLGRQSDLKLSLALSMWFWLLMSVATENGFPWGHTNLLIQINLPESLADYANTNMGIPLATAGLMPLLAFSALALLLGHLQKAGGSTYLEDFHPLAANPRLYRFRRCWTLTSWLLAGLPLSVLWTDLAKWLSTGTSSGQLSLWWIGFLLVALVLFAGSLFHLRDRLFYGDAQTTGQLVVRDLGLGTYWLIMALLGLALLLPFLQN